MNNSSRFVLIAVCAECFIIYASVLVKLTDIAPINLGFYRVFLALPFFFIMASYSNKRFCNVFKNPLKDILLMMCAGAFFAGDLVFFNLALRSTSVANVNLICALPCFILVPIGVIFFKEKMKIGFIIGGAITIFGVFVLIKGKGDNSAASAYGDFLAFLSVICYGVFLSLIYSLRKRYGTKEVMFFSCIGSSAVLFVLAYIFEGIEIPKDAYNIAVVMGIVLCGQVIGQGVFNYVMGKVNTQTSSLLLLFSPVIAAIMGFVFLGERLSIYEMLGIAIIIVGIFFAKRDKV